MSELNPNLEQFLFEAALEKPSLEERAAFLNSVCQGNPALRDRLELLLEGHLRTGGFLADRTKKSEPKPFSPPTEEISTWIGRYKVLEKIGEGGFGEVWMAEQKEPVKRRVALKIIKLGMDTKQVAARFEAERQALALMDHSNIAKVLDGGATDAGRPYFVMELVRGARITDYCDQNQLSTQERLKLFTQVCRAVQHAHQKGIIHRDIKPSNILVTLHDGLPVPKVIDFGIAKATQLELTEKTLFTQFHQFLGTPAYVSPEQAEASGLDIDTRCDIYSLGVLLYELLTGKTPFDSKALLASGLAELRRRIREVEPVRPSTRLSAMTEEELTTTAQRRGAEPPRLIHQVQGDLDLIVMKCLEKDRARRYETANGLARDIERHLGDEPVSARPPSALYRLQKAAQRHRVAFTAGATVTMALVLGAVVSMWQAVRATRAERQARNAQVSETSQRQRAEAASLEVRNTLAASDFLQAARLVEQDRDADALSHLQRSLSMNPSNPAAWTRLATLLSGRTWMIPVLSLSQSNSVISARFSPDGKWVVTASADNTARVWDMQTGRPLTAPLKHSRQVSSAEFSPDGKRIVTISGYETARVWDAQTGQPLTEPLEHFGFDFAQFSPDGKRIVAAWIPNTARVWDAQSGLPLTEPLKHSLQVLSGQFSPDGKRIVTASRDKTARVWDAQNGRPLTEPLQHSGPVRWAEFSPDGKRIVTASDDNTARVWDAQSGQSLTEPLLHSRQVNSARFSADGKRIVTASDDNTARVWDAQNGRPLIEPLKHSGPVGWAEFSSDGKRIATASSDNTARVWDAQDGQPLTEPMRDLASVLRVQFSTDGRHILTASSDGTARLWEPQTRPSLAEPLKHSDLMYSLVSSAEFSPDGKRIVTASYDKTARVWDAQNGRPLTEPLQHSRPVRWAEFSPDGKRIVTASLDGTARVWDAQTGQPLTEPLIHSNVLVWAQFSPDGKRIVTASRDNTARVWDAQTGRPLTQPLIHSGSVNLAQFSPDGKQIVTASSDNTARVWDVQGGQVRVGPFKHSGPVTWAQFSPDAKRIVTASEDHTARVWETQTGQPLTIPLKHSGKVLSAEFSSDGKRIVTASDDKTSRVWDAQSGHPLTEPLRHSDLVRTARFSPDGKRVITASFDMTARVWDAQSGLPLTEALKHSGQVFSGQFSPDGKRIVTASRDNTARVWDIAPSSANYPDWLLQLAEALSGQVLNRQGMTEPTSFDQAEVVKQIRAKLKELPEDDDWALWGRWLLSDPSEGTISPFSKITIPEYIESRIKENTAESLGEAERSVFADTNLLQRISEARETLLRAQQATLLRDRADFLARQGKWKEAAAEAINALQTEPSDHVPYHMLAPLFAAAEDFESYQKLCQRIIATFSGNTNVFVADRMAKDCLILPSSGADLQAVGKLAETAATAGTNQSAFPYFQCTKALADYRQARFATAVEWAQKSVDNSLLPEDLNRFVEGYTVLAMAHFRLNHTNEAKAALAKARELANKMVTLQSGYIGSEWRDWIIAHALMAEAKALIEGQTQEPAPPSHP